MPADKGWSARFRYPIQLPGGGEISTLREAGDYIIALPEREQVQPHWQTALRRLIAAAEDSGIETAETAMRRALSHGDRPKPPPPRRKRAKAHRIIR